MVFFPRATIDCGPGSWTRDSGHWERASLPDPDRSWRRAPPGV